MLVQQPSHRWETRPLDAWNKAKELRARFYKTEASAHDEKIWLVEGSDATTTAGIGNCHVVFCQPYGASMAAEGNEFARQCRADRLLLWRVQLLYPVFLELRDYPRVQSQLVNPHENRGLETPHDMLRPLIFIRGMFGIVGAYWPCSLLECSRRKPYLAPCSIALTVTCVEVTGV